MKGEGQRCATTVVTASATSARAIEPEISERPG